MKTIYILVLLAPATLLTTYPILTATISPGYRVSLKPETWIEKTLYAIRDDLKQRKSQFPQLASIEDATIKGGALTYRKGLLKDGKPGGPLFAENGCDVYVEIKYPATRGDIEMRPLGGSLFSVKNGKSFAVWSLARAENHEQGNTFIKKVNELISLRLTALQESLKR